MPYAATIIAIVIAMASIPQKEPSKPISGAKKGIQQTRWEEAKLRPEWLMKLDKAVDLYTRNKSRYDKITRANKNGVPSQIIFGIHGRESSWSFSNHLHEGSPLTQRTRYVPRGRIPSPIDPPYTFEQSAEDALYVVDKMQLANWKNLDSSLQKVEEYNGTGYQKFHKDVPSPYLWSGTTVYSRGKYASDGVFSPTLVDKQLGVAAILKRMEARGISLPWKA